MALAIRNAMQVPALHVCGKVYHVWPKGSSQDEDVHRSISGMQAACQLFLDRLDSELPGKDLRMQLHIFDLRRWQRLQHLADTDIDKTSHLKSVKLWLSLLKLNVALGLQEYRDAACLFVMARF